MKYLILILLVGVVGCDDKAIMSNYQQTDKIITICDSTKSVDKYRLFNLMSDSFNINNSKVMLMLAKNRMDSAQYFMGKAVAYYELENKFQPK